MGIEPIDEKRVDGISIVARKLQEEKRFEKMKKEDQKMEYGDILNDEAKMKENRDKAYDFQRDPFRTRNSRPEAKYDLSGNETTISYRNNKKSFLHRFLEKRGLLSADPYKRMHQKMRYERLAKIGTVVGVTSLYLITSV